VSALKLSPQSGSQIDMCFFMCALQGSESKRPLGDFPHSAQIEIVFLEAWSHQPIYIYTNTHTHTEEKDTCNTFCKEKKDFKAILKRRAEFQFFRLSGSTPG